jgi:membrane protein
MNTSEPASTPGSSPSLLARAWALLRRTVQEWQEDNVPTQAAALAYYTVFALAPLLLVVLAVVGLVAPADAARERLLNEIAGLIGQEGADWIAEVLERLSSQQGTGVLSVILGTGSLLLGATGAFGQLQVTLNRIWDAKPPANLGALVRARAVSFGLVLALGFLLLVSLTVSAAINALGDQLGLGEGASWFWSVFYEVFSLLLIAFLFSIIYHFLPDVPVRWKDAFVGGLFTALLFNIGKALIGLYLGNSATASVYGAAGTLVILLLWVYYAAQIVLFGAEFTQVYAQRHVTKLEDLGAAPDPETNTLRSQVHPAPSYSGEHAREPLETNPTLRTAAVVLTLLAVVLAWRKGAH